MEVVVKLNAIFAFLLDSFQKNIKTKLKKWSIKRIDRILGSQNIKWVITINGNWKRQKSEVIRPWT